MDGVKRPPTTVLARSALVPPGNQQAPPHKVTHVVSEEAAFYFKDPSDGAEAAGHLLAGSRVLLVRSGTYSTVIDERGLMLFVPGRLLRPM